MAGVEFSPLAFDLPLGSGEHVADDTEPSREGLETAQPGTATQPPARAAGLDPAWRSGGIERREPPWGQGSSVASYGVEADVARRRELLTLERSLTELTASRRLEARRFEADIWREELVEVAGVHAQSRAKERTALQGVTRPVGLVEALLHPRGRAVLAGGVAATAAAKGLLSVFSGPANGDDDGERALAAQRWSGVALLAGLAGLVGIAQSMGADGVRADRRAAADGASSARLQEWLQK